MIDASRSRTIVRTTVNISDERGEQVRALAEAEGVSQSEWLRRAIDAACTPGASPDTSASEAVQAALKARDEAIEARLRVEAVLAEKTDEIRWLRGEVSKLNDRFTPALPPPKRRYFWQVWLPREGE